MLRCIVFALILPFATWAATPAELERLHKALATDALMGILASEGLDQAEELRETMFPGRGGVVWAATTRQIYAQDRLGGLFREGFDKAMQDVDMAPLLAFYEGDTGALIAKLELEARRAIQSKAVEDAARAAYGELEGSGSEREALMDRFADVNDLIDRNVAGALNANLAFYRGLGSGEAFDMTEDQMIRDVWEQEASIREDTTGWIFGYMTFAYETLSEEQLRAYVDFTSTEAGRDLNRALFAGFDAIFTDVSYELGAAAARFSLGDEL